jgi:hypothetical protein
MKTILIRGVIASVALLSLSVFYFFWIGKPAKRPAGVPSKAIFIEESSVPFRRPSGIWLYCWMDNKTDTDRCRITDENGAVVYEDVFLAYQGVYPVPEVDLMLNKKTGGLGLSVNEGQVVIPLVFLENRQILIPKSYYQAGKRMLERAHQD